MKPFRFCLFAAVVCTSLLLAQNYAPPQPKPPDAATLKAIAEKTTRLGQAVEALRRQGVPDALLVEVHIYHKAAVWITRHSEYYQANDGDRILSALDRGLLRARQLAGGDTPWLHQTGGDVVRAYRSRIDGSVQPYAVTLPESYGRDRSKKWRLDVVLHGRDATLTEIKFLTQHAGDRPAPKDQPFIKLDIFGRGNNAYRWAGENDVIEAIEAFAATERFLGRDGMLDSNRVVLRGFSMGGAGTWHLGLHSPDRWCCLGPGAGFTTTHGYVKDLPQKLSHYQEACLHIYDAIDYAENAFNVPVVAYAGSDDPQLQAAKNIVAKLKPLGIPMTLLVAPDLGHQFPAEWQKKAEEHYASFAAKGRDDNPPRVRFITYTMKYPKCAWVQLLGLERHYERASVDATRTDEGVTVSTANVRGLRLGVMTGAAQLTVTIDGQKIETRAVLARDGTSAVYLDKQNGRWSAVLPQKLLTTLARRPQKATGLQGPIDDAFTSSFLCVRGSGTPWHKAVQKCADAELERFRADWNKFFRADLPVKNDEDVTDEDIAGRHLVLFGDPGSNSLIAHVLDALPLTWTKEKLTLGGHDYPAAQHVPALVYPSPLNAGRYVVLNSGHTFRAADFRGTNALLYPRLGDYAVLKPGEKDAADVVTAGLFDEFWQVVK